MTTSPLLCVHLIDGDSGTCWCSRGQIKPDVEPVWIRIDLPVESEIRSVRIVPHKEGLCGYAPLPWQRTDGTLLVGQALPKHLTVKLSRDGHHWDTVYETNALAADEEMNPIEINFDTRRAKQIWIIGEDLSCVLSGRLWPLFLDRGSRSALPRRRQSGVAFARCRRHRLVHAFGIRHGSLHAGDAVAHPV